MAATSIGIERRSEVAPRRLPQAQDRVTGVLAHQRSRDCEITAAAKKLSLKQMEHS
jgi:hypothetical protein